MVYTHHPDIGTSGLHKTFSVQVMATEYISPRRRVKTQGGVNDGDTGTQVRTTFEVMTAQTLHVDDSVASYDTAMSIHDEVWQGIGAMVTTDTNGPVPLTSSHRVEGSGTWLLSEYRFHVDHLSKIQ